MQTLHPPSPRWGEGRLHWFGLFHVLPSNVLASLRARQGSRFMSKSPMTSCELYLDDPGDDRLRVILRIRDNCDVSLEEARELVSRHATRLMVGPRWQVEIARDRLKEAGAAVRLEQHVRKADFAGWSAHISRDGVHCKECGAVLFYCIPGLTSIEEIRAFAQSSLRGAAEDVAPTGWLHPGVYCPNKCTCILVEADVDLE